MNPEQSTAQEPETYDIAATERKWQPVWEELQPFRADDIRGLKRLYRNTAPRTTLKLTGPATVPVGTSVTFKGTAADRERNLSEIRVDYGDGEVTELFAAALATASEALLLEKAATQEVPA